MQQICHQLRSGSGDMDFEDIIDVIPHVEIAHDLGTDLDDEQRFKPRAFKTHLWEPAVAKGGRYIVVVRHPYDLAISLFKFFEGWMFEAGAISLGFFTDACFLKFGEPDLGGTGLTGAFHHMASW
eukprot:scpid112362/ scgid16143/ 